MPWIEPDDAPDYRFLNTGDLQYRDRFGRFSICGGCNADDWYVFQELREEAVSILAEAEVSAEECYANHNRFQWLVDWCLEASGIDPDTVSVRQALRLLFARKEGNQTIAAPLLTLNQPPPPRHPTTPGADPGLPISDKASLLAALVGQCSSLAEVDGLMSRPFRELLAIADDRAWASKPAPERQKAMMLADAPRSMSRIDDLLNNLGSGDGEKL
jgi:hypothetical protein